MGPQRAGRPHNGRPHRPRWWENAPGRIQIEEKADVKKRLGRSPDDADALLLSFWDPPIPRVEQVWYEDRRLRTGHRTR